MNCPNCGANNINGSTFCIKCGTNLKQMQQPMYNQSMQNIVNDQPVYNQPVQKMTNQQPMQNLNNTNYQQPINNVGVMTAPFKYFMYIITILLKPFNYFKEEEEKLNNPKASLVLTLIITGIMTVINLIKTIFGVVRVLNFSWTEGYTYTWEWANIKEIKYLEVIGKNFLIYAGIILAITIVFYLGSLVIKKQLNFIKTLSISATSVIPAVVGLMILAPLGGMIWDQLSIVFSVVGVIYSFLILYELINNELQLEGDTKIWFNLVCLAILIIVGYYVCMKLLFGLLVDSELGNLSSLFG